MTTTQILVTEEQHNALLRLAIEALDVLDMPEGSVSTLTIKAGKPLQVTVTTPSKESCCCDCTHPERGNRSICMDCSENTYALGEYYAVHNEVWLEAVPDKKGMLCIGCLETRLGRELKAADFSDYPINRDEAKQRSPRLQDRLTRGEEG